MRFVGTWLLVGGLVMAGGAAASAKSGWGNPHPKPCEYNGVVYSVGDYCYTSCNPKAACELLVCFTGGTEGGAWAHLGACKQRDCRKVC